MSGARKRLGVKVCGSQPALLITLLVLYSCTHQPKTSTASLSLEPAIPILNYTVLHVYAHDPTSYTEGFLFHKGHFFESSGAPVEIPQTRSIVGIALGGTPLDSLNELEYIKGYLYANRYLQNYIVKIDPSNGKVLAKLDLTSLVEEERNKNAATDVLNGIAYNPETDKIYVTGKLWAGIYEIDFRH